MRKNRSRLIFLTIILFISFGLLVAKDRIIKFRFTKPAQPFASIKKGEITQLSLKMYKKGVVLIQKNSQWFVEKDKEEYPANQEEVNKIINNMIAFKKDEVVSKNKDLLTNFGLLERSVELKSVEIKTKNKIYTLYLGKDYTFDTLYAKLENENEVYLIKDFEKGFVEHDYRDLKVKLIENEEKISSISIESSGKPLLLEKKSNEWFLADKKAKRERVDFFINDLKNLMATNIMKDDILKSQLTYPSLTLTAIEGNSKKKAEFTLKDITNKNTYYLKTSSPYLYELPAASVESLHKEQKDFIE